jgi:hypothetical protein
MTDVSIEQSSLLLDGMNFSGLFHHQISRTGYRDQGHQLYVLNICDSRFHIYGLNICHSIVTFWQMSGKLVASVEDGWFDSWTSGEQQFRGRRVKSILSTQGEIVLSSQNLWWCVLLILYVYIGGPEERCAPGRTWSVVFDQETVSFFMLDTVSYVLWAFQFRFWWPT